VYSDSLSFVMSPGTLGLEVDAVHGSLAESDLRELYHPSVVAEVQRRLGIKAEGE
jgi:hypothetical protein